MLLKLNTYGEGSTSNGDGGGSSSSSSEPIGNRLYRYEWINDQLVNPILLLDLPAIPGPRHNGGAIRIGPDNNVYVIIGDVDGHLTQAQNQESGEEPDGTSGILRITQDGKPVVSSVGGGGGGGGGGGVVFLVILIHLTYTMHMEYETALDLILIL